MTKFSVSMLISRDDRNMEKAVDSALAQEPDEVRAYIDAVKLKDFNGLDRRLRRLGVKTYVQHMNLDMTHHENVVSNYHRAILEAENKWVVFMADDDELLGTKRSILIDKYGADDIGIIHGDKIVKFPFRAYLKRLDLVQLGKSVLKSSLVRGGASANHRDVRGKIHDGTVTLNREAFKQVHPFLDHGFFCDWKAFYWILRTGWKSVYVPEVLYLHKVHVDVNPHRKRSWGTWNQILDELDKIPYDAE